MTVQRDVRLSRATRAGSEEKIRAAEAWNDLQQSKRVLKDMPNSEMQLSLWPENDPLSER
jgi:hypothetical protein